MIRVFKHKAMGHDFVRVVINVNINIDIHANDNTTFMGMEYSTDKMNAMNLIKCQEVLSLIFSLPIPNITNRNKGIIQ